jgi:NitT/TauT family transport system ATP-binding protein
MSDTPAIGLQLTNVRRVYDGRVPALTDITLKIDPGEFLAILGPSGCGKSTLLRLISALDKPDYGSIQFQNDSDHRRAIAYVFQDAHLLPWRNVLRNVALPLELMGVRKAERIDAARLAIEQVGLADAARRFPSQLSGGMRMRVSLARALVTNPRLLLLDEPFAALDEITRQKLDEQLRELWCRRKMTVIFVTHSTAEATFLANRAVVMSPRPGRIVLDQPINLPEFRHVTLRGEPTFAAQTHALFEALEGKVRR